jgi:hypothetical protein
MSSGLDVDEERQRLEALLALKKNQRRLPQAKVVELQLVSLMLQARDHAINQEISLFMAEEAEQKMLKELAQGHRFTSSPGTIFQKYWVLYLLHFA